MSRIQVLYRNAAHAALPLLAVVVAATVAASGASAQALSVKLWSDRGDGAVYQPGDAISISVRTNHDANLIVYEVDAEGAVHLLFPTEGSDMGIEGGTPLELPGDPSEQMVVDGPTGEGYIVAIAAEEPFRAMPWYLRPRDERAEEMGYTSDDRSDDGVTRDGKIVGDPFVAMERIRRQVLSDPSNARSFATGYTSYYVHEQVRYPRYLCNDCHRPGYYAWWDGFDPYYANCSVFEFRVNSTWWWGPTYWSGFVPYYAYVYRTNCPPRYRPSGNRGTWYSSWDGWRRWTGLWNGPLRRTKSLPPSDYISPARWDRARRERGAQSPTPPGFMASAHDRWTRPGMPGSGSQNSGIRRERRAGWSPGEGSPRGQYQPTPGDGSSRGGGRDVSGRRRGGSAPDPAPGNGRGGSRRGERPGAGTPPERGVGRGGQQPNPGGREARQSPPAQHSDPGRWRDPHQQPAPAPAPEPRRESDRGEQRRERPHDADAPRKQDPPPSNPPAQDDRPQRGSDWNSRGNRPR